MIPDLQRYRALLEDRHAKTLGFSIAGPHTQALLDGEGLWWVTPFAVARSGAVYGWRRAGSTAVRPSGV